MTRNSQAEGGPNHVQNLMMPRASGMDAQFEIAAEFFDLRRSERLEFVQIERRRNVGGRSQPRPPFPPEARLGHAPPQWRSLARSCVDLFSSIIAVLIL